MVIGWMDGGADECKENIDAEQCHPYEHTQTEKEYVKLFHHRMLYTVLKCVIPDI